ncbi:MAG: hypothetical protein HN380_09950 [Victivallales bacterium]|nr:hypothetical protein [Victivallales bacterium]
MSSFKTHTMRRIALLPFVLLAIAAVAQPAKKPRFKVEFTRGKGKHKGKLFVSARCEDMNPMAFFGALLIAVDADGGGGAAKVSLLLRDTSVRLQPRESSYSKDDAIAYYRKGTLTAKRERWEHELVRQLPRLDFELQACELTGLMRYVWMGADVAQYQQSGTIFVRPREEVGGHARSHGRRAYRLPEGHTWKKADKLPRRLAASGPCCAYDPGTRLLNIVGQSESFHVLDDVLEALGAELVWRNEVETW